VSERFSLWRDCIKCGTDFEIGVGEQDYYTQHRLSLPKRCDACRLALREGRHESVGEQFQREALEWARVNN
jgi:hypothetical protein